MSPIIMRYFSIIFCSIYSYYKILGLKPYRKFHHFLTASCSFIIVVVISYIFNNNSISRIVLTYFIYFLFITLYTKTKVYFSFIASIISFTTSYLTLSLACAILSALLTPFKISYINTIGIYYTFALFIIQILLTHFLFRMKRLKNGLLFLFKGTFPYIVTIFCICILGGIIYAHFIKTSVFSTKIVMLFSSFALAFLLLHWWRRKITQEYVEKLRLEEREELYNTIASKEREIEKLRMNNEHLGRIIHKDNKLIPAMEYAVCNYLQTITEINAEAGAQSENTSSPPPEQTLTPDQLLQLQKHGEDLVLQLQQMASERDGILSTYEKNFTGHTQIGIPSIDAVLQYMEKRAVGSRICYKMKFDPNLKESMLKHIEEHDVLHLLSDLIENAIIAVSHTDKKEILIHLGFSYDHLFFDIYDSGVPFTIETYQNFGSRPYTTYPDSGGSGIGLTDIWTLKRKYKASLQIYESPPGKDAYSKRIRILFDRKNHFLIQTYRAKEIRSNIIRNDLHVFPYSEHSLLENTEEAAVT